MFVSIEYHLNGNIQIKIQKKVDADADRYRHRHEKGHPLPNTILYKDFYFFLFPKI